MQNSITLIFIYSLLLTIKKKVRCKTNRTKFGHRSLSILWNDPTRWQIWEQLFRNLTNHLLSSSSDSAFSRERILDEIINDWLPKSNTKPLKPSTPKSITETLKFTLTLSNVRYIRSVYKSPMLKDAPKNWITGQK